MLWQKTQLYLYLQSRPNVLCTDTKHKTAYYIHCTIYIYTKCSFTNSDLKRAALPSNYNSSKKKDLLRFNEFRNHVVHHYNFLYNNMWLASIQDTWQTSDDNNRQNCNRKCSNLQLCTILHAERQFYTTDMTRWAIYRVTTTTILLQNSTAVTNPLRSVQEYVGEWTLQLAWVYESF